MTLVRILWKRSCIGYWAGAVAPYAYPSPGPLNAPREKSGLEAVSHPPSPQSGVYSSSSLTPARSFWPWAMTFSAI